MKVNIRFSEKKLINLKENFFIAINTRHKRIDEWYFTSFEEL